MGIGIYSCFSSNLLTLYLSLWCKMMTRFRGNGESALTERVAKSRYKMVYNPNAYVYHVMPANRLTIDFYKRRAFLQGVSNSYTILRGSGSVKQSV